MSHETLWAEWKATDSVDFGVWLEDKYAALEAEVASLRSVQQIKPKMPSWADVAQSVGFNIWPVSDNDKLVLKSGRTVYDYIARHFGL
jgi:hypothetical protein